MYLARSLRSLADGARAKGVTQRVTLINYATRDRVSHALRARPVSIDEDDEQGGRWAVVGRSV